MPAGRAGNRRRLMMRAAGRHHRQQIDELGGTLPKALTVGPAQLEVRIARNEIYPLTLLSIVMNRTFAFCRPPANRFPAAPRESPFSWARSELDSDHRCGAVGLLRCHAEHEPLPAPRFSRRTGRSALV